MLLSHLRGRRLLVSAPPVVAMFADGLVVGRVRRTDAGHCVGDAIRLGVRVPPASSRNRRSLAGDIGSTDRFESLCGHATMQAHLEERKGCASYGGSGRPPRLRYIGVPPASPLGVLGARVGLGVRASPIVGPLQGVAFGVTRKLHSTLGGAEFLVDDLQGSLHRIGTEATDAVVKWMVEELQEEQHRHDHRDHGPHE